MPMQSLRNIENNTPASATDVQWNYGTIESFVNNNLLNIDGSIPMTGQLTLAGNPLTDLHAVTKQYVDAIQPVGMIVDFAGATAPSGWLLCNGVIVDQASYPALYAVCGSTYNTGGEGGTQFRLPDFTDRSSVGKGTNAVGDTGGTADAVVVSHDHTPGAHTHSLSNHTHNMNSHTHGFAHTHVTNISHDHGSKTVSGGSHAHTIPLYNNLGADGATGPNASSSSIGSQVSTNTSSSHSHSVSVPALGTTNKTTSSQNDSTSDGPNTPNTETPSANITGTPTQANTGTEGVTGTDLNYHPFLVVNKIIKAA